MCRCHLRDIRAQDQPVEAASRAMIGTAAQDLMCRAGRLTFEELRISSCRS